MAKRMNAQEVAEMFEARSRIGRPALYPWHEWEDGEWWMAESGTDFTCRPASFRASLYRHAKEAGLSVSVQVDEDVVHFRFYPSGAYKTRSDLIPNPDGLDVRAMTESAKPVGRAGSGRRSPAELVEMYPRPDDLD